MRGRELFSLFRFVFEIGIFILRRLPRSFSVGLYAFVRNIPTKFGIALRYMLVARLAKKCGQCVAIHEGVFLFHLENMELGDHISVHPMCYLDASGGLKIDANVSIAHASTIMTTEHRYDDHTILIRDAPVKYAAVTIEENVWIGCGVRVLAGTTMGTGSVVGAGAVVTKDVSAGTICAGVPAKPLKLAVRKAA